MRAKKATAMAMIQHRKFARRAGAGVVICAAALSLLTASAWFAAHAQAPPASTGHRQPKAADVPKDASTKETPRVPEDTVPRALMNICRGCSPIIPVREVPRYDLARACPAGPNNDSCSKDEATAKEKLVQEWTHFTAQARSDCVQTTAIGGNPSYVQLIICLKVRELAPTLPEGQ